MLNIAGKLNKHTLKVIGAHILHLVDDSNRIYNSLLQPLIY